MEKIYKIFKYVSTKMYYHSPKNKKTQISIFLVTIIIVLTVSIIYIKYHTDTQTKRITSISTEITETSEEVTPEEIKSTIRGIAKDSLEQALIISGLKGGFIYDHKDNNYTYLVTNYPPGYTNALISRFNINLNNMKVLAWSKDFLRDPKLTVNDNYYKNNIKKEMEDFIKKEIKERLNKKIKGLGWNVTWDGKVNTNLEFNDNSVVLVFNISLLKKSSKNKTRSYFDNDKVEENIRYKTIIHLIKSLISDKLDNRSLNSDDGSLKEDLRRRIISFNLNPSDFELNTIKVIDKEDYKGYIFEIKDNGSKILNNPFVFRVGYLNNATNLDLSSLGINNQNKFYIGLTEDNLLTIDLAKYIKDTEAIDILNPNYYFKEEDINTPSAHFKIDTQGNLQFIAHRKGIFAYPIIITDNEVKKTYTFYFVIGSPSNKDNEDAINCFEVEPLSVTRYTTGGQVTFPVSQLFKRTFEYIDSTGKHHVFGYGIKDGDVRVTFNCMTYQGYKYQWEICDDTGSCSIEDITSTIGSADKTINLGTNPKTVKVIISSSNPSISFAPVTYELEIYPADCLGPFPREEYGTSSNTLLNKVSGPLTCCDFSQFNNVKNVLINGDQYANGLPPSYTASLANNGDVAFEFDGYLCMSFETPSSSSNTFNPKEINVWSFDQGISSVFEGKIRGVCSGDSPFPLNININPISTSSSTKTINIRKIIDYFGSNYDVNLNGNVDYASSSNSLCQHCIIPSDALLPFSFKVALNPSSTNPVYARFIIGLKSEISGISSSPSSSNEIYYGPFTDTSEYVRCDNNWYYYSNSGWIKMNLGIDYGIGGAPSENRVSRNYCEIGQASCNRKDYLASSISTGTTDIAEECKDNYVFVNGLNIMSNIREAPSSWTCNTCTYTCHCIDGLGNSYSIITTQDIKCNGLSIGCPAPDPDPGCETLCQNDPRHGHKDSVTYVCNH